ncbi:MAG: hypothetical protein ABI776_11665 [Nocardioidaceae bacterium]
MAATFREVDSRTLRRWDGLILFWVVLWVVLAGWTGLTLWQAADTGETISSSGRALHSVGQSLSDLSDLPLVPDRAGEIGGQVVTTADQITVRGQEIRGQLHQLALLLGLTIAGISIAPVIGFYLPLRLSRHRDVVRLRDQIGRRPDDEGLDRYLAEHARRALSYDEIARLVADPADQLLAREDARRLADAELARLAIRRPSA